MKSTENELIRRGKITDDKIVELSHLTADELIDKLHNSDPSTRSAAAVNLKPFVDNFSDELLLQLSKEKCLYTRLAICECLQNGNIETARKMTDYLGCIGDNQHKILPDKVSAKKSFPLPRDIIARSLGKMNIDVFSAFIEVIENNCIEKICEVLDAIGYMVFYNQVLATEKNCKYITSLSVKYAMNPLILWKMILCLSAFPCEESKNILLMYKNDDSILGLEAKRSLKILESRK